MITLQFTTIVHTAGEVSWHIFQLVRQAHKMSSEYIWIPYSGAIFEYRTDKRLITSNKCNSVSNVKATEKNIDGPVICMPSGKCRIHVA